MYDESSSRWIVADQGIEIVYHTVLGILCVLTSLALLSTVLCCAMLCCAVPQVCLFAESSSRWIVADQGILMNGAADAVSTDHPAAAAAAARFIRYSSNRQAAGV
jgi:hypothetical protein